MDHESSTKRQSAWTAARLTITVFLFLVVRAAGPHPTFAKSDVSQEYQVKAAFLYNFAKFVDWPADAFENNQAPIALCVYGKDPFEGALDDIVRGKSIGSRSFVVRRPRTPKSLNDCQIVFVGDSGDDQLRDVLSNLDRSKVLSVGESPNFAELGGQIQFVTVDGKIRFLINIDSVNRAGFKMSSKLLALAKVVHDSK